MVPLLALGIPFSGSTAMLLAALMMQGILPGPLLMQQRPDVFWGVIASMYIGNVALLILNFPLVGMWVSLLRIPQSVLLALILLLMLVGTYSLNNSVLDLIVLIVMGVIGYVLRKLDFDLTLIVLGLVLGSFLEKTFRQSLFLSRGDPLIFFQRPISGALLAAVFLIFVLPLLWRILAGRRRPDVVVPATPDGPDARD